MYSFIYRHAWKTLWRCVWTKDKDDDATKLIQIKVRLDEDGEEDKENTKNQKENKGHEQL